MSKIGYARISSADQNLSRQLEQLKGCEKIFQEVASAAGSPGVRPRGGYSGHQ
mgnify:FL=1